MRRARRLLLKGATGRTLPPPLHLAGRSRTELEPNPGRASPPPFDTAGFLINFPVEPRRGGGISRHAGHTAQCLGWDG